MTAAVKGAGPRTAQHLPRVLATTTVLAAAIVVAVSVASDIYRRPVEAVQIAGEFRHVKRADLERAIADQIDRGFFQVDVAAIRDAADRLPWVKSVRVRRVWPGNVQIAVEERTAVARWNETDLIEADGTLFSPSPDTVPAMLPDLHGPPGSAARVLERFERFSALTRGSLGLEVHRLTLLARGEWQLELGSGTAIVIDAALGDEQMTYYFRAMPRVFGERFNSVERIDMRYGSGFAVQWRRDAGATEGETS